MTSRRSMLLFPALLAISCAAVGCGKVKSVVDHFAKSEADDPESVVGGSGFVDLGEEDYSGFVARKDAVVVVDFHASWCGPCRLMGPALEKAAGRNPEVVFLGKVDVDQEPALAAKYGVSSIPDVRIFKNGRQVERMMGFPGEADVLGKIAAHAADIETPDAAPAAAASPAVEEKSVQPASEDRLSSGMSRQ